MYFCVQRRLNKEEVLPGILDIELRSRYRGRVLSIKKNSSS